MCLLAGLDMRTSEVAFVGPVYLCPSEPTGKPKRPLLFWGRVLCFRILRDLRGWASKDRVATHTKKRRDLYLPDREASLIKKEYCRCGPHPLQVISSRARPPLVKGASLIGPLYPEFRGWPLWFMTSIALRGP